MKLYKSATYCLSVSIYLSVFMDIGKVCAQTRPAKPNTNSLRKKDSEVTPQLLQRQIELGGNPSDWGFNAVDKEDVKASLALQESILLKGGYQKSKEFLQKAQAIFRLKDSRWRNDPIQLEVGFDERINSTQCFEPTDGLRLVLNQQKAHVFISAKHQLVGNLYLVPQLVDYQKEYPESKKVEQDGSIGKTSSKTIHRWSDIADLDQQRNAIRQTIIARNKYLFNNDKSQLQYLLNNDGIFMNALVEIFGYAKDENLLKAVFQKYSVSSEDFEASPDKLGRIIFPKDCNNKLEVRKDLLAYISNNTSKNDVRLMLSLGAFASKLIRSEDETLNRLYSKEDKREMVAYIAAIYDPAFKTYRETNIANWPKVPLLALLFRRDPGAEQYIRQQKYYGLFELTGLMKYSKENFSDDFLYH